MVRIEAIEKKHEQAAKGFATMVKDGMRIGLGSSKHAHHVIKALRNKMLNENSFFEVVPTSIRVSQLLMEYRVPQGPLEAEELDLAIEFADRVDSNLNFVKIETHSLIRDKMVALSAKNLVIVVEKPPVVALNGFVPFEISKFGASATIQALASYGAAALRRQGGKTETTDGTNLIVDVEVGKDFDLEDLDIVSRKVPGVLETGVFYHCAEQAILLDEGKIKSFEGSGDFTTLPKIRRLS